MKFSIFNFQFSILAGFLLLLPGSVFAARIYFDPAKMDMEMGQPAKVDIMLDPEGESLNAVELEVRLTSGLIKVTGTPTDNSIVSLWIESPKQSVASIKMAGIMPGGFSGLIDPETDKPGPGKIASIVMSPEHSGIGKIDIANGKVIKNDGKSTLAKVTFGEADFVVKDGNSTSTKAYDYQDDTPPDDFVPHIISSKYVYDGKNVLIFNTSDSGSGIDHYEVKEGDGDYARAESPYLLVNQDLSDTIYVRAIDLAGNAKTVTLSGRNSAEEDSSINRSVVAYIALFVLGLLILVWLLSRKAKSGES